MRGEVSARYVPLAALGMTLFSFDLGVASRGRGAGRDAALIGVVEFLSQLGGLRIFGDLLGARGLRRLLCRAALRDHPEPQRRGVAGAHHRRQQCRERAVHGRRGVVTAGLIAAGLDTPDAVPDPRRSPTPCHAVDLQTAAARRAADAGPLPVPPRLPGRGAGPRECRGRRRSRRSSCPTTCPFSTRRSSPRFCRAGRSSRSIRRRCSAGGSARFSPAVDVYPIDPTRPMATKSLIKSIRDGSRCVIFPGRPPQRHRRRADEDL